MRRRLPLVERRRSGDSFLDGFLDRLGEEFSDRRDFFRLYRPARFRRTRCRRIRVAGCRAKDRIGVVIPVLKDVSRRGVELVEGIGSVGGPIRVRLAESENNRLFEIRVEDFGQIRIRLGMGDSVLVEEASEHGEGLNVEAGVVVDVGDSPLL